MSCSSSLRRTRLPQSEALDLQLDAPGFSMLHSQLLSCSVMDLNRMYTSFVVLQY